jgi:hypothetical protein
VGTPFADPTRSVGRADNRSLSIGVAIMSASYICCAHILGAANELEVLVSETTELTTSCLVTIQVNDGQGLAVRLFAGTSMVLMTVISENTCTFNNITHTVHPLGKHSISFLTMINKCCSYLNGY